MKIFSLFKFEYQLGEGVDTMKLLIVDDERLVREGLKKCFDWSYYGITDIQEACNGEEALERIVDFEPDIILLDVMIPVISGIEVSKAIKDKLPSSKIIFISGYSDINYLKLAFKVDAVDYIFKPVEFDELESAIRKAVDMLNADTFERQYVKRETAKMETEEYTVVENDSGKLSTDTKFSSRIVICAKDYIENNYMKDISIKDIADHLYLTPNYVSLLFKQEMNITIMTYVTQLRMKEAIKLLKDNNLRVCEVADNVGYKDANHFSKLFKKYFGYNPSDFRFTQCAQQSEGTVSGVRMEQGVGK